MKQVRRARAKAPFDPVVPGLAPSTALTRHNCKSDIKQALERLGRCLRMTQLTNEMQDLLRVNGKDRKVMIGWSEGKQAELKDLTRFLILLSFFIYRQLTFKQYDPCSIDWAPVGCFRRPPGEPPGTTQTLTRIILPQNVTKAGMKISLHCFKTYHDLCN